MTGITRDCMELSRAEVEKLIIDELRRRYPGASAVSIDFEPRSEGGFCHCWWIQLKVEKVEKT